jgi:hypothetical protein
LFYPTSYPTFSGFIRHQFRQNTANSAIIIARINARFEQEALDLCAMLRAISGPYAPRCFRDILRDKFHHYVTSGYYGHYPGHFRVISVIFLETF